MTALAILTAAERSCLARYLSQLAVQLGSNLEAVWAYGSAARGETWPTGMPIRSDLDLLVLTRDRVPQPLRERLFDATYPLFLECGRQISPTFRTAGELERPEDGFRDYVENVRRDAVVVWPPPLIDGIAAYHEGWPGPWVEDEVFGTHEPAAVAAALTDLCLDALGSEPTGFVFYEASVGCVAGLRLADGRRVVVKAHKPSVPRDFLQGTFTVQAELARRGFPCPRPLVAPRPIGLGHATVEELLDRGERRDGHEPAIRDELARTLALLVRTARDLVDTPGLATGLLSRRDAGALWPEPHSRMFDFGATGAGAEWIDELAAAALAQWGDATTRVVGHNDWSVKHFRFVGDSVAVVYDWDSLEVADEAELVGDAARTFPATWYMDVPVAASAEEARAFVAAYERASGRRFDADERRRLAARATYGLAYSARCEHCGGGAALPGGFRDTLRREAAEYLRL